MKNWLQNNEIYFKTLGWAIIALAAVFIAVQANSIANKQAQIATEQAQISRQQQLPVISVRSQLQYEPILEEVTTEELWVSNFGAPVRTIDPFVSVFFRLEYGEKGTELDSSWIPIYGYYATEDVYSELNRNELIYYFLGNWQKFVQCEKGVRELADKQNAFAFLFRECVIEVMYRDVFNEIHYEIYILDNLGRGHLVEEEEQITAISRAIHLYRESIFDGTIIELSEITPKKLMSEADFFLEKAHKYKLMDIIFWRF